MGISYDAKNKKWNIEYENANRPILSEITVNVPITKYIASYGGKNGTTWRAYQEEVPVKFGLDDSFQEITSKLKQAGYEPQSNYLILLGVKQDPVIERVQTSQISTKGDNKRNQDANTIATTNNKAYDTIKKTADTVKITNQPDDYKKFLSTLNGTGTDDTVRKILKDAFNSFYKTEIVSLWDQKNAAKVPFEGFENTIRFDPNYYGSTDIGKSAKEKWDEAVKDEDLYILGRFPNYESYALWHYSNIGKNQAVKNGQRDPGFKPLTPTDGFAYAKVEESVPQKTDAQRQKERDNLVGDILGLKTEGNEYKLDDAATAYKNLVINNKDLQSQWDTAKNEILYANRFPEETKKPWAKLFEQVKEATGAEPDIDTETGFGEFLAQANQLAATKVISSQDSEVNKLLGTINAIPGIKDIDTKKSEYDIALKKVTGEAEAKRVEQAAVLQKQFLEDSRVKLIQAKKLEQRFDLLGATSVGQELLGMRENITNSILQDTGIGGILAMTGKKEDDIKKQFGFSGLGESLDTGQLLGSRNGLLYNWEEWFYDQIEKKYSGGLDVPNDYVPEYSRTEKNGFVSDEKINSWKTYDDAYKILKTKPNDLYAKNVIKNVPKDYIAVDKRRKVKQEWLDYEKQRKEMGWVDQKTLIAWSDYDDAYRTLNDKNATQEQKENAQKIYDSRPTDYIEPGKRLDQKFIDEDKKINLKFAQDFYNEYLLPRFNASKSMIEFRDYINVDADKKNIFQTEDRLSSLKNAAEAMSVSWLKNLDKLNTSKFNADFYFDPAGYYIDKGIGAGDDEFPVLLGSQFQKEWGSKLPDKYVKQKNDVSTAWEAAKKGETTKDAQGKEINWQAMGYMYGLDINKKEDFAKLHYELIGKTDPDKTYDPAPDVFSPDIAKIYLSQVLTPYLGTKYAEIGTVFGEFADPDVYADNLVDSLDLIKNKEQVEKLLKLYNLSAEDTDLTQLKTMIADSIKSNTALEIREQIKQINEAKEVPTQEALGVEYIQRESDVKDETGTESKDALYQRFKKAGYKGTENDFYTQFMPDATEEDKKMIQSLYGGEKITDRFKFKPSGDPFVDLANIEELSSFDEDQKTLAEKKAEEKPKPKSKYFSMFPDEDEEEEEESASPVKIKTGKDILNEFKTKLKIPTGKSSGFDFDFDNPFSGNFFSDF